MISKHPLTPIAAAVLVVLGVVGMGTGLASWQGASATTVDRILIDEGPPPPQACASFAASYGAGASWDQVKFDRWEGTHSTRLGTVTVTSGGIVDGTARIDWSAGFDVVAVYVKAGRGGHLYVYDAGVRADTDLSSPTNSISFVALCAETPRPRTPEPTATPEPTSTESPTATPEPTSTGDPTATPEPTSTGDPTATPTSRPSTTPRSTATPEPTTKPEPTSTEEPAASPGPTATTTASPAPSASAVPTETLEPTETPLPSPSPQPTAAASATPVETVTTEATSNTLPSPTEAPRAQPTATVEPAATATPNAEVEGRVLARTGPNALAVISLIIGAAMVLTGAVLLILRRTSASPT